MRLSNATHYAAHFHLEQRCDVVAWADEQRFTLHVMQTYVPVKVCGCIRQHQAEKHHSDSGHLSS